jgi:uncharacterized membrane protein
MFALTNDKIYIGIFLLVGVIVFGVLLSMYIKRTVTAEIEEVNYENKKKKKYMLKKKYLQMQQMDNAMQQKQQMMHQRVEQPEQVADNYDDAESYIDPVQQPDAYQPDSRFSNIENDNPKDNVLMRDIMDNQAINNSRR